MITFTLLSNLSRPAGQAGIPRSGFLAPAEHLLPRQAHGGHLVRVHRLLRRPRGRRRRLRSPGGNYERLPLAHGCSGGHAEKRCHSTCC